MPRRGPRAWRERLRIYLAQHAQALVSALGRLWTRPLQSGMTAAVLGIALALPAGFLLTLQNLQTLTADWDGGTRISVFLSLSADEQRLESLAGELDGDPRLNDIRTYTPDEALEAFREFSGMDDALALLDDNPLPATLVLSPRRDLPAGEVAALADELSGRSGVDQVQLDQEWLQRLHAIIELVERGVWVVGLLLGAAVLLVVGNTIRLAISNRREEIIITKLIGATNGFVRRPFLYEGAWYGLLGGVLAWLLLELSRLWMGDTVSGLASLYSSGFHLSGPGISGTLQILGAGMVLGWLGAWLAVSRHLSAIEPR